MAHIAPHTPLHTPPSGLTSNQPSPCHIKVDADQGARCAIAAIEAMDTEIGRLLDALRPEVRKRTTVIFLGDNGSDGAYSDGQPFFPSETKSTVFEGGIRIPFIVSGNMVAAKGRTSNSLVSTVDVFSTVLEIMDGSPNINDLKIDSVSFVPILKNPKAKVRDFIFSELYLREAGCPVPFNNRFGFDFGDAYVTDRYKLVKRIEYSKDLTEIFDLPLELYDVIDDPFEDNNLLNDDGTAPNDFIQEILDDLLDRRNALITS